VIEPGRDLIVNHGAIGADTGDYTFIVGIIHQIQEVFAYEGFPASDTELENPVC
jgi:hypothetical protein